MMTIATDAVRANATDTYRERFAAREADVAALKQKERVLSYSRMAAFLTVVAIVWIGLDTGWFSPWWALLPVGAFFALVVVHDRVIGERLRAQRAANFYAQGLARVEDRWMGKGDSGERFLDAKHPYAADLDIFGSGSLFERLCTVRTHLGEQLLASWLLQAAPVDEIRVRQDAVRELAPRVDLREALAIAGETVRVGLDVDLLTAWSSAPPLPRLKAQRAGAIAVVVIAVLAALAWPLGAGPLPLLAAVAVIALLTRSQRPLVQRIVHAVQHPYRDLGVFAELLRLLEREQFEAPRLQVLRSQLNIDGEAASQRIARLQRLVHLLDAMKNQFFAPIGLLLLWETHIGLAIEAWRVRFGAAVGQWLAAVSEIETLAAFSAFTYENADAVFPTIRADGPCFAATQLGHPLLAASACIRNDVHLGAQPRVLVISGSNMSGKSTLMRSVGINAVLALAGAPVRAACLEISALSVGASIRTLDSLQEGTSRFYAEIKRLRQLMDLAQGPLPLLFLLDEVLHGTNSHDRGIGAEAVVKGFLARGAIGLVTTHDLALARVAEALVPIAVNVHFEDHLEDGEMRFDYQMRPGVVTHSNALALMRAVGLEV